jgi:hypothetical protein
VREMIEAEFANNDHFTALKADKMVSDRTKADGKKPKALYETAVGHSTGSDLPEQTLSRDDILALPKSTDAKILKVAVSALAWGGMQQGSANRLFRAGDRWLKVCGEIARGDLSREEAYQKFHDLKFHRTITGRQRKGQHDDQIPGMGPAYFTKLIYFLMPRDNIDRPIGYIMDQWSGCAINLLSTSPIVLMDVTQSWTGTKQLSATSTYTVSPCNSAARYERFCQVVELVGRALGYRDNAGEEAEIRMFGKSKSEWRQHMIAHRTPG